MRFTNLVALALLAITGTEACAQYKWCWCETDGVTNDKHTDSACVAQSGWQLWDQGVNESKWKLCYRWQKYTWKLDTAIDNCGWDKLCIAAGAKKGYCRGKINGLHSRDFDMFSTSPAVE